MNGAIRKAAMQRNITRLCHFTPSHNLSHIMTDPQGILATKHLQNNDRKVFNPTDTKRLDNFSNYVCCSIEYPNVWYFGVARSKNQVFDDWVVIYIKPHHLWSSEALFCHRNAAAKKGYYVKGGLDGFDGMFELSVVGQNNNTYKRKSNHPDFLPTDLQAEVLIPDCVAREDLLGIGVKDTSQAKREIARLKILKTPLPHVLIAPALFDKNWVSSIRDSGQRPYEEEYAGEYK